MRSWPTSLLVVRLLHRIVTTGPTLSLETFFFHNLQPGTLCLYRPWQRKNCIFVFIVLNNFMCQYTKIIAMQFILKEERYCNMAFILHIFVIPVIILVSLLLVRWGEISLQIKLIQRAYTNSKGFVFWIFLRTPCWSSMWKASTMTRLCNLANSVITSVTIPTPKYPA